MLQWILSKWCEKYLNDFRYLSYYPYIQHRNMQGPSQSTKCNFDGKWSHKVHGATIINSFAIPTWYVVHIYMHDQVKVTNDVPSNIWVSYMLVLLFLESNHIRNALRLFVVHGQLFFFCISYYNIAPPPSWTPSIPFPLPK